MTYRSFLSTLCALSLVAHATGQNDEADFNQRQAKVLNAFAKKAFDKGFPRQAKIVWLQTIKLYDPDNAEAWKGMHYVKIGSSWNPDTKNPYPTADTGNGAEGAPLFKAYEALRKDLASQHKMQAEKWNRADRTDRANYHWKMVLRWVEKDEQAQKALEHHEVGGVTGTGLEQILYDRSKAIEKAVEEQSKIDYEVKRVEGVECPPLDAPRSSTSRAARSTSRCTATPRKKTTCSRRCVGRAHAQSLRGRVPVGRHRPVAVVGVLQCQGDLPADPEGQPGPGPRVEARTHETCGIGNTHIAAHRWPAGAVRRRVRNVARACSHFGSDALVEGIGHTFVGMIFNNNRLFAVDLKKQEGTTASEEDREYTSPDFDVWKNLSLEMAWKSTGGVPANKLPFCDAANVHQRAAHQGVVVLRLHDAARPEMLRTMDQIAQEMKKQRIKQPLEFEKRFDEARGQVSLAQLDKEWEDFWTGGVAGAEGDPEQHAAAQAISKGVDKWLEAFNAARKRTAARR
jgi:hypothetical protein